MAFDAAAAGARRGPDAAEGGLTINALSARVWTLVQTRSTLDNLSAALGGASDTTALRAKLNEAERTAQTLQTEVDLGLRRLRVATMSTGDTSGQKQLKRLEEQYGEVRESIVASVTASRLKRRQYAPSEAFSVPETSGKSRGGRAGRVEGANVATEHVIQMQNFSEVDAAIIQERADDALAIARDSAALGRTVQDLNELVVDQGQILEVVETNIDKALVKVEAGNEELEVAATYQNSYRCKCILFWVVAALAAALITIPLLIHYVPKQS